MKHIAVTGLRCQQRSDIVESIEKKLPQEKRLVSYNQHRYYLERNGFDEEKLDFKQRCDMHLQAMAGYVGSIISAHHAKVRAVLDGSLIDSLAYAMDQVHSSIMNHIHNELSKYKEHTVAMILAPDITLTGKVYEKQVEIFKRIMDIIDMHQIPYEFITETSPDKQADEILHYIDAYDNER